MGVEAVIDCNTLSTGLYYGRPGSTNIPDGWDNEYFFVISYELSADAVQIAVTHFGLFATRAKSGATWGNWRGADTFGCSTPSSLASLLGIIPIVSYDGALLDDYEQKFIMPYIGGNGAEASIHIPFQWGNPKKNACLSVHISQTVISVRSYWNNAWSESKSVPLT